MVIDVVTANKLSRVIVGSAKDHLSELLEGRKMVVVITDENVMNHYSELINSFEHKIIIYQGEEHKCLSDIEHIYTSLLEMGADRHSTIVGIGGGIVTDITGFVASTYQRGVDFGFVATTLLSQVDASVGGKNGVNHNSFKNMIGVFNQPRFVVCDAEMLSTIPEREFRAGLAEIIKAGVIKSSSLFAEFENNDYSTFKNDKTLLEKVIFESIEIKARVVEEDEREKGERKKLNLGHTIGHAIEKSTREFNHGEAVAIGMVLATEIGVKLKVTDLSVQKRLNSVIERFGFKIDCDINREKLFEALKSDKKRNNNSIDFVLPTTIGEAEVVNLSFDQIKELFVR